LNFLSGLKFGMYEPPYSLYVMRDVFVVFLGSKHVKNSVVANFELY